MDSADPYAITILVQSHQCVAGTPDGQETKTTRSAANTNNSRCTIDDTQTTMFEKTLSDVIKGIRSSKRDSSKYISQCIAEIRTELTSADMFVKANALEKLTFLQMMGYSMAFASFQTTEVMSSPRFAHKRIGYLAASQGFTQDTEEVILAVNLLKKELRGAVTGSNQDVYNAGLAINCLSNIVTEELARDLLPELTNLLSHPQPYLRKKAILVLFKTFVRYPDGLRLTFNKLQQSLEDANSAVVSCAVNVITELSDKNPRNYLHLAPTFFQLLSRSSNNWMLIKVVKLLGSLVPEEPRLARKLLEPLAEIVRNTQAKSLLFESVYTITLCLPYARKNDGTMPSNVPGIVELCANTLLGFVEENDQNLKYLGLVGFGSLMQSHPHVLGDPKYRPIILSCLSDEDETIRSRALELCPSITTRKNLTELVGQLLSHVESASGSYKVELVNKIVEMCSGDKYALLQDFTWYLGILFRLGHLSGVEQLGELLRTQITDVALRVLPVRNVAVRRSMQVLLGDTMSGSSKSEGKQAIDPILPALAWIVGEYSDYIREAIVELGSKFDTAYLSLVRQFTDVSKLSPETEKVFVQAALKVTATAAADRLATNEEVEACILQLCHSLPIFSHSLDVEVATRAINALDVLTMLGLHESGNSPAVKINISGDLLGLVSKGEEKEESTTNNNYALSLGEKARACSDLLSFIAKGASPMKPCGTKLQRKRFQADIGGGVNLTDESGASVFAELIRAEVDLVRSTHMNIKSISFTQQVIPQETAYQDPMQTVRQNYTFSEKSVADKVNEIPKRRTAGDPFYLAEAEDRHGAAQNKIGPRFGAIELLDSDNDYEEEESGKKSSKKAKKKKHRPHQQPMSVTMFDDDDDSDSGIRRDRRPGKEFAGLAKVDLTVPLDQPLSSEKRPKKSDKKISKKEKKKKASKVPTTAEPFVGDLLDLSSMGTSHFIQAPAPSMADPIGTAFDSFSSPFPDMPKNAVDFLPTDRLPWLKVVIKDQSSDAVVEKVELLSRLVRSNSTLQTLVRNESDSAIANVSVELKSPSVIINHGMIPSRMEIQKETNVQISAAECNRDVKGSIVVNGRSIPLKLRLPFAYSLVPDKTMSLQDLAVELAAPVWSSGSAKISLSKDPLPFTAVVEKFQFFLSATVLDLATSTAALASRTADGFPVRFLLKMVKERQLKIDVKAKEATVVDALVADLKRVRG